MFLGTALIFGALSLFMKKAPISGCLKSVVFSCFRLCKRGVEETQAL